MPHRNYFFIFFMSLVGLLFSLQAKAATFNMMLETDSNETAGAEIFMASFDNYADLLSGNVSSSDFSQLNIGQNFSVGGLAYDGQYRMMLETDTNEAGGAEIFMASFDSFMDLLDGNVSSSDFSQLNIGQNFSVGGLAYDGQYRMMLETDTNEAGGAEIFLASFDNYADLLSGSLSSSDFSQLNIGQNFSVGGLTSNFADENPGIPPVPVPAAVWLFGSALIGLLGFSRRRKIGLVS